jgi:hypothetical protein
MVPPEACTYWIMRWLLNLFRSLFGARATSVNRPQLLGMYFDESNKPGRKKANRDRS